jgi:hypothetical protein
MAAVVIILALGSVVLFALNDRSDERYSVVATGVLLLVLLGLSLAPPQLLSSKVTSIAYAAALVIAAFAVIAALGALSEQKRQR